MGNQVDFAKKHANAKRAERTGHDFVPRVLSFSKMAAAETRRP